MVPEDRGYFQGRDLSATIHPSSILLRCDKCLEPMFWFGDLAHCKNESCDEYGKQFRVELPQAGVTLTPMHTHEWPNGTPRYDESTCPSCIAARSAIT